MEKELNLILEISKFASLALETLHLSVGGTVRWWCVCNAYTKVVTKHDHDRVRLQ